MTKKSPRLACCSDPAGALLVAEALPALLNGMPEPSESLESLVVCWLRGDLPDRSPRPLGAVAGCPTLLPLPRPWPPKPPTPGFDPAVLPLLGGNMTVTVA